MTFKDLQKLVQSQSGREEFRPLQRLRDKPFWIWDQKQHKEEDIKTKGDCCFNHVVGLPRKDKEEKPIFEYEKLLLILLAGCSRSRNFKYLRLTLPGIL